MTPFFSSGHPDAKCWRPGEDRTVLGPAGHAMVSSTAENDAQRSLAFRSSGQRFHDLRRPLSPPFCRSVLELEWRSYDCFTVNRPFRAGVFSHPDSCLCASTVLFKRHMPVEFGEGFVIQAHTSQHGQVAGVKKMKKTFSRKRPRRRCGQPPSGLAS
jgi:hypothetical protein